MEPKARDVIGAGLLVVVLIGLVAILFISAWQNAG
jgi:hypothetical protein